MGDIFKLKISVGNANVELEGNGTLVHTLFSELREFGLGKLSNGEPTVQPTPVQQDNSKSITQEIEQSENKILNQEQNKSLSLPNIKDIVMKDLPKTEAEWVLVYALYASEEGKKTFTADNLRQKYHDTNRFTENRSKNFATNLKKAVAENWFTCINENDYALSEVGKTAAYEVTQRSTDSVKQKAKKPGQSFAKASYQMTDLGLDQAARDELKKYVDSFDKLTNTEKALVIANWLRIHGNIPEVNEHIIFSALKTVAYNTSFDIKSSLKNGKNRSSYFTAGEIAGCYKVHHIGEDHVRELENKRG